MSRSCRLGVVRERDAELGKAHGGCLGVMSRRRAWKAAKSIGEPSAGVDPVIPEWGNPDFVPLRDAYQVLSRLKRRPNATLYAGDQEAMDAVPNALEYRPVYAGKG